MPVAPPSWPEVGSVYSTLMSLPVDKTSLPLLFAESVPLVEVTRVFWKIPVLTPVSVRTTCSISPVVVVVTLTVRVSATVLFLFWSPSATRRPMLSVPAR